MPKQVNYQQFITALKKLIEQETTTNLILITEDKHSLWLGMASGVITSIIFGPKRGKSAIPFISRVTGGQLSLDTKTSLSPMPDLPSTEVILAQLDTSATSMNTAQSTADFNAAGANLAIEELQQLFKRYIGPIANMIMPGMIKKVGAISSESQLQALIDTMAKEVEGIGDLAKFRQEATDIIEKT
ncbi:MAG: hypothetical protein ABFS39_01065 [Pseudomonadota bacterium]